MNKYMTNPQITVLMPVPLIWDSWVDRFERGGKIER